MNITDLSDRNFMATIEQVSLGGLPQSKKVPPPVEGVYVSGDDRKRFPGDYNPERAGAVWRQDRYFVTNREFQAFRLLPVLNSLLWDEDYADKDVKQLRQ